MTGTVSGHVDEQPARLTSSATVTRFQPLRLLPRYGPELVLALVVEINLVVLRGETLPAERSLDQAAHIAFVRWAAQQISAGHSPLDGWFPSLALGAPQFHQYQVLPHLVAGLAASLVDAKTVVRWSTYLLLASWPVAVFISIRLVGLSRRMAAAGAVLAPLVASTTSFGFEYSTYVFRGQGLWTQLFGMWLLPISMAWTWRAATRGRGYTPAAVFLALTICCHPICGYFALLWVGVVLVAGPTVLPSRIRRLVVIVLGAGLISSWFIVPALTDLRWRSLPQIGNRQLTDSFGAAKVLGWLGTGEIFDARSPRLPVITALVFVGAFICAVQFRRNALYRCVLLFTALNLVLFFGRPTLGGLIDVIPGLNEIPLHRFVAGVQLGGIFLAAIGAIEGADLLVGFARRHLDVRRATLAAVMLPVVAVVLLLPAAAERVRYGGQDAFRIRAQRKADQTAGADLGALLSLAKARGGGRIFAGDPIDGGFTNRIGFVPLYEEILNDDALGLGFSGQVASLSADTELEFKFTRLADYQLLGVHYLIWSAGVPAPVRATRLRTRGGYTLWEVGPGGYLSVDDVIGPPISADRSNIGIRTLPYLESTQPAHHETRPIAYDGDAAAAPTVAAAAAPSGVPGVVRGEHDQPDNGTFTGTVTATRRAVVVLKESYHPRWTATIDGRRAPIQFVAPSFVAVTVPPGTHHIRFHYQPYPGANYALLLGLGLGVIGMLVVLDRSRRRTTDPKVIRAARRS